MRSVGHDTDNHSLIAEALLQDREGDIVHGKPVTPKIGRLKFGDAAADLLADYRTNGKRSLNVVERRVNKHLTPFFAGRKMAHITTTDVRTFIDRRQTELTVLVRKARTTNGVTIPEQRRPASNAEINRELALLKRMFSLAIQAGKLLHRPYIPMLRESNVRTGFFEPEQYRSVLSHLPLEIRPIVQFAYITGWRIASEVLPLEWRQVTANEVRLDAGTTKNREGRVFPMTAALRTVLDAQRVEHERLQQAGHIAPQVFFREVSEGRRVQRNRSGLSALKILEVGASWQDPGRLPHDLRRTAVRNLVRG